MTKFFPASGKKLRKRYNLRIFMLNILPLTIVMTLLGVVFINKDSTQPISYYYAVSLILTASVGYSFVSVFLGSVILTQRLKYNTLHTYVEIQNRYLVVSRYYQAIHSDKEMLVYKKLWVIKLSEIEDIYYYKKNVIVIAPTRLINGQADWLTYRYNNQGINFDNWWYDSNGAKKTGGVEIHDMFANPQRIARTIQTASGRMQVKATEHREFRERMLKIAGRLK